MFKTTEPITIFTDLNMKVHAETFARNFKSVESSENEYLISRSIPVALRHLETFLERLWKEGDGIVTPETLKLHLKIASRRKLEARHPARIRELGEKGVKRFKKLLDMDHPEILSDFRLCILYYLVQKACVKQRRQNLLNYMTRLNIDEKDIEKIDPVHFMGCMGDVHWTLVFIEVFESYSRSMQVMARSALEGGIEEQNDMKMIVDSDGMPHYITNKSLAFSKAEREGTTAEKKFDRKRTGYSNA